MDLNRYDNPLSVRYASAEMSYLFSPHKKFTTWRRLWLALAEAEQELGLGIPDAALRQIREHLDDVDLDLADRYERRFRHDVMAHIHALGDQAPEARPYLHLGATSAFVTDNAELIIMRDALRLLLGRLIAILATLESFARRTKDLPCLAYTHFQPAQLTTVGKRAVLWMQDFALDMEVLCERLEGLRFRGCKGTTGTQASFVDLFAGDHDKVRELERRISAKLGFTDLFPVTGQTYPRKQDSMVLDSLSGIAQSSAKLAGDLRLLQHEGELFEAFETDQIGSSAMAYKRNPMRAERISGLARFVMALPANTAHTAASQWLERSLDDSANRRLVLPEAFLASDAILVLIANVIAGLEVGEDMIRQHVNREMPFMATERWLMQAVAAGGDRQTLHDVIRRHSLAVAEAVQAGAPNDLLARLAGDPAFHGVSEPTLQAELDPHRFVGRAPQQVEEFLGDYLHPLLERARKLATIPEVAEVTV